MALDALWKDSIGESTTMSCEKFGIQDLPIQKKLSLGDKTDLLRIAEDAVFIDEEYLPEITEATFRALLFSYYSGLEIGENLYNAYELVMDRDFWQCFMEALGDASAEVIDLSGAFEERIQYKLRMIAAQQTARMNEMLSILQNADAKVEKLAGDMANLDVNAIVDAVNRLKERIEQRQDDGDDGK